MYWWRKGIERPVERVAPLHVEPPVPVLSASS
jgi:hypothetical protein